MKEHEDEIHVLRGEVNASKGQQKGLIIIIILSDFVTLTCVLLNDFFPESIDAAVQTEYESEIKALNAAMSTLEVCINIIELVDAYTSTVHLIKILQTG